jgi:uncharacterized protein YyaL (SSP411 family)
MNRLHESVSPYLLAHKDNPIKWHYWSDEAFNEAKARDCPIFISIGYHACHWCHVMARETFSDQQIAQFLNEHFVCIKVDREVNPEVDDYYMQACILQNFSGGWPLNVFCTPDGKPFFAATYFPPYSTERHIGFYELTQQIYNVWENNKDEVLQSADNFDDAIKREQKHLTKSSLNRLNSMIKQNKIIDDLKTFSAQLTDHFVNNLFDSTYGGFHKGAKFPQVPLLNLALFTWYFGGKNQSLLELIIKTLDSFALKATYDHAFGGFFRYSTTRDFTRPHFEKMLYDQAQLAQVYLDVYKITKDNFYKEVVQECISFVLNHMALKPAGFASALLADTLGVEGASYLFSKQDFNKLDSQQLEIFHRYYDLIQDEDGLLLTKTSTYKENNNEELKDIKQLLFAIQKGKPTPDKDDKAVLEFNAMMIKSILSAGFAFKNSTFVSEGLKHLNFIESVFNKGGQYFRVYREEKLEAKATAADLLWLADSLIEAFKVTDESRYLDKALKLAQLVLSKYVDVTTGLVKDSLDSKVSYYSFYDNTTPCANSKAAEVLYKLGVIFGRNDLIEASHKALIALQEYILNEPFQVAHLATQAIIASIKLADIYLSNVDDTILDQFRLYFNPRSLILNSKNSSGIFQDKKPGYIYVCFEGHCSLPTTSSEKAFSLLEENAL